MLYIFQKEVLLQDVNFDGIELVQAQLPAILQAKDKITGEAQRLLNEGINNQVKCLLHLYENRSKISFRFLFETLNFCVMTWIAKGYYSGLIVIGNPLFLID